METRREYMAKLDRTKNDEEVAYEFFKYCMLLDLTKFQVDEPPRTELFEEQRSHNRCALELFLEDATSGAYPIVAKSCDPLSAPLQGEHTFTAAELFGHLKKYMADTGAQTNIDSSMALGICLSKSHKRRSPKVEGRIAKYKLHLGGGPP